MFKTIKGTNHFKAAQLLKLMRQIGLRLQQLQDAPKARRLSCYGTWQHMTSVHDLQRAIIFIDKLEQIVKMSLDKEMRTRRVTSQNFGQCAINAVAVRNLFFKYGPGDDVMGPTISAFVKCLCDQVDEQVRRTGSI